MLCVRISSQVSQSPVLAPPQVGGGADLFPSRLPPPVPGQGSASEGPPDSAEGNGVHPADLLVIGNGRIRMTDNFRKHCRLTAGAGPIRFPCFTPYRIFFVCTAVAWWVLSCGTALQFFFS